MISLKVLIVDDDFRVAAVHAAVAGAVPGCEVIGTATTLAQARESLPQADLVVADEYLPDGSGSDLIGASEASVLLVTAADHLDTVRRALTRGAVGYIVKPFELRLLTERLAAYVRFRAQLAATPRPTQADIDQLLAQLRPRLDQGQPPKGRSAVTASAVADLLRATGRPHTVMAVAEEIGISRATARRYLSDLVADGDVELLLRYGTAGRPQHSYVWVT